MMIKKIRVVIRYFESASNSCYLSYDATFVFTNKRQRIPKGQSKKNNPEKLATQGKQDEEIQNKNTTQYVLDTTIHKQK